MYKEHESLNNLASASGTSSTRSWKQNSSVSKETPASTRHDAPHVHSQSLSDEAVPLILGVAVTAVGTVASSPFVAGIGANMVSSALYGMSKSDNVEIDIDRDLSSRSGLVKILETTALIGLAAITLPVALACQACKSPEPSEEGVHNTVVYNNITINNTYVNSPNLAECTARSNRFSRDEIQRLGLFVDVDTDKIQHTM